MQDPNGSPERNAKTSPIQAGSDADATAPLRRFLLIANPTAGRGRNGRLAEQVNQRLSAAGLASSIEWTTAAGDAERIAGDALASSPVESDGRLCIVACGGDGTTQEVVNALMKHPQSSALLGQAPAGRCNDFATAFGITSDADRIAEVLITGPTRRVDIGRINQRYFCTVAAMGFDAAVSRYVNDHRLPFAGTSAYVIGVLRVLLTYKPIKIRLSWGDSIVAEEVFLVASANTPPYGGKMRIAPQADIADGMLEICLISKMSRLRGLNLLRAVLQGRHSRLPGVRFLRTDAIEIETTDRREVWADGEYVTDTPVRIEAVPDALEIIEPTASSE
ncbi:MAG: diacylglycerol kinase family lipid kinase [Planctomycetes bacterium]|nr:diacylglycerol kinase family lipid kinase [Planctomycetota bacterium]